MIPVAQQHPKQTVPAVNTAISSILVYIIHNIFPILHVAVEYKKKLDEVSVIKITVEVITVSYFQPED